MLGYRTVFSVEADAEFVLDQSVRDFRAWLGGKPHRQYDGDVLEVGTPVRFDQEAAALLLEDVRPDGSRSVRATLTEVNNAGRWTTRLTAAALRGKKPWVWVDVDGPAEDPSGRKQWTSTPGLVRRLLAQFDATDGRAELASRPTRAFAADVDSLLEMICAEDRRGLLFIAACPNDLGIDIWLEKVASLLSDTVGLASAYVLDTAAARALNEELTETHTIPLGTMRTFRPGADPASEWDAYRHRILGQDRIISGDSRSIRKMLGWRARELGLESPLPRVAVRLDSRFEALTNEVLVTRLRLPALRRDAETPLIPLPVEPSPSLEAFSLRPIAQQLSSALRRHVVEQDVVAELERLAAFAQEVEQFASAQRELGARLDELSERARLAEEERDELKRRLEDVQLDHWQTTQDLVQTAATRDTLRLALAKAGKAVEAWLADGAEALDSFPETFAALVERLGELDGVVFTGDREEALALDEHDPTGSWAIKSWEALKALEGYVAAKREDSFSGNVHMYLSDAPPGRPGFSKQRHAPDESDSVKNNPRHYDARRFPMPNVSGGDGREFMGAHFKIAQWGLVSPRLHYFDATGRDGFVYVGYLGRHLPTKATN